jgi:adenine deaminase
MLYQGGEMTSQLSGLISVARGDSPADLVLANARIINVFTGEIEAGDVAIFNDHIAGIGHYQQAREVRDLKSKYLAPGFINGHTHIESSMLNIGQYARAVVPRGTLAVVTDLHELANVCGLDGLRYILNYARRLPLELFIMAPSCVPASYLETSGTSLGPEAIRSILRWRGVIGLGEVMSFPGVIGGDSEILAKISLAGDRVIDGHAPSVGGKGLNAYIAAGINSDHESVSLEEAREKLKRGMYLMIREGSSEKNLEILLPLVTDKTYKRCLFVVDDRSCSDLLRDGDVDAIVRKAISLGMEPVRAIQLATVNAAERFGLKKLGAIAPGYLANLTVFRDLSCLEVDMVFHRGRLVAEDGKVSFSVPHPKKNRLTNTVNIKPFEEEALRLSAIGKLHPVIEVVPGQILTKMKKEIMEVKDGVINPDIGRDILKLVVMERHGATGNIGVGLVRGFGLKRGALASSIAHDSHNIIAVGTNNADIALGIREVERLHGGLVVIAEARVMDSLALPVAGLLSSEPLTMVAGKLERLEKLACELGTELESPFATLSFLALPVIPEIRLTDLGLVDVSINRLIG